MTRRTTRSSSRTKTVAAEPTERLYWRAVVRTGGQFAASRQGDRVEWHLVGCSEPFSKGEHCTEGELKIETLGNPDGHCMVNGACGRCGEKAHVTELVAA